MGVRRTKGTAKSGSTRGPESERGLGEPWRVPSAEPDKERSPGRGAV